MTQRILFWTHVFLPSPVPPLSLLILRAQVDHNRDQRLETTYSVQKNVSVRIHFFPSRRILRAQIRTVPRANLPPAFLPGGLGEPKNKDSAAKGRNDKEVKVPKFRLVGVPQTMP